MGIDLESWISGVGRFDHFVGYSSILWPNFAVHDDCVIRAGEVSDEHYRGFLRECGGDKREVEKIMNHLHVCSLFCNSEYPLDQVLADFIAQTLIETWTAKLGHDFPDRRFVVDIWPGARATVPVDQVVTIWQLAARGGGGIG